MSKEIKIRVEYGKGQVFEGSPVSWPPEEGKKFIAKGPPSGNVKYSLGTMVESLALTKIERSGDVWTCTEKNGEVFKVTELKPEKKKRKKA